MTKAEANEILDAVRAGKRRPSVWMITRALQVTGDMGGELRGAGDDVFQVYFPPGEWQATDHGQLSAPRGPFAGLIP